MRKTQLITTPPQNSSREMILPAYKAAISLGLPILPTQHHIRKNRASGIKNRESPKPPILPTHYHSRATSHEPPTTTHVYPPLARRRRVLLAGPTSHEPPITSRLNPNNSAPKVKMYEGLRTNLSANYAKQTQSCPPPADSKPFIWQRITKIQPLRQHPKTNPNKPKRTQTNPKRTQFFARQGPSKPKRTQTNPKQTQFPKNPKSNATSFYTKRYDNMPDFASPKTNPNEPNQSQFPKNPKIYATSVLTKDYENETTFSLRQNKPKRTQSPYAQQNEHNFHSHKGLCQ